MWLLLELGHVEEPVVLEERRCVLVKEWWEALSAEPLARGCLEGE